MIMLCCNIKCMNIFFKNYPKLFCDDFIVLACDGAGWHKSKELNIPKNIELVFISPYIPEMNPIEQIWEEIRKCGFKNKLFRHLKRLLKDLTVSFAHCLMILSKVLSAETGFCPAFKRLIVLVNIGEGLVNSLNILLQPNRFRGSWSVIRKEVIEHVCFRIS